MADFLYVPAHKQVSLFAGVSATVDSTYDAAWLCDGRGGRPIRGTGTSFSATITPAAAGTVSLAAVCHSNLSVSTTFGGDLSATVAAGALSKKSIRFNGFTTFAPVASVDSVTIAVTGNAETVIIGEIVFGEYVALTLPTLQGEGYAEKSFATPLEIDLASIRPYSKGLKGRVWSATWPALTTSERDGLIDAEDAQWDLTRPTLVVPRTSINDALLGFISDVTYKPSAQVPNRWEVTLTFTEEPRKRWP